MPQPASPTANTSPGLHRLSRRRLAGQRVVITGGSSGVGRALAVELSRRGGVVLATARRQHLLEELAATSGVSILAGDITSAAFRSQLVAVAERRLGGIGVVVAAAGSGAVGPFSSADPATLRRIMEVDFLAPAELVRLSLPALHASPDPAIVLVGSILGLHPLPWHADYCAAKSALHSLAAALRVELSTIPIDVLLCSLGPTDSEFWDSLLVGQRPRWSHGRSLSAAVTARIIATALERRRKEVFPGWPAKGYALAARLCPWLIDTIMRRRMAAG